MSGPARAAFRRVDACRVCGSRDFTSVVSLGETPLANAFVDPARAIETESRFPLESMRCLSCALVQLSVVVTPELMFRNYLYATSASPPMVRHFESYADDVVARFAPPGSLVVEIGSNDGVLLRPLKARGADPVGIEPAANLAREANAAGLETVNDFFGTAVARRLVAAKGRAKAALANNVLAHIDDLAGVLSGLDELLDDDGVLIAEVPYLVDLLDRVEYDTIYHEHLSYFAVAPLERLLAPASLEVFDVRRLPVHGGSIRVFVGRAGRHAPTAALIEARAAERASGLEDESTYARFADRVAASRDELRRMVGGLRAEGRSVAALGASAKGNTLLNYCGLGPGDIEFVADSTPLKQGLLTPGTRIPIREERALMEERPDCTLLLAWNYADALLERHRGYLAAGGRFIHPIPLARIIGGA
ncbi:MAG: methyltransferase domain-containing protein [Candidatus Limnocylindria bacterium]